MLRGDPLSLAELADALASAQLRAIETRQTMTTTNATIVDNIDDDDDDDEKKKKKKNSKSKNGDADVDVLASNFVRRLDTQWQPANALPLPW